jgi:hypothetical protein
MKKFRGISLKLSGILLITRMLSGCIDPFYPKVQGFESLIVVDAFVTDEVTPYYCKLSRSFEKLNNTPEMVKGATVVIKDDLGASHTLHEISARVYKSDSLTFRGEVGRSYTLSIRTKEGGQYESEPAKMLEVPDIDSLYFGKDSEIDEYGERHEGIRIYFSSKKPVDGRYLRWAYEEWWKFHVPYPKSYDYINEMNIIPILSPGNVICWRHNLSDDIIIGSAEADMTSRIEKKPLLFIAADQADRLMMQYFIKVRQYSVSKKEYEFWDHLKQINEAGGDIFDRQPFQITGNIHRLDNPKEQVLGYFKVSSVRPASMYITRREIDSLGLKQFDYSCDMLFVGPNDDFPNKPSKPVTYTQLYYILIDDGYTFIDYTVDELGLLNKLIFVKNFCSDCTVTGNPKKPDFWIDLK